ncbi:hypothetical protein Cgig2_027970 [Carnegiea gigantea]|uniref:Late embryogenesis abundant protein LEA-2 subgroup domain-containing protein n=1 Tax=Carnegiea gigantea TaxID=171969 RepID=A0A9Q1GY19_9CARY|nr:hypothetical protein Cgig2_016066 [Carnegiea gigantea]KAJ8431376.1 hypothetical protein Cgig2_027970 [Carnegiea gigantea]
MANRAMWTCVVITMLSLGAMSILIAWLADRMKPPAFTIERSTITSYDFTGDNLLNATVSLTLRSHNCDPKYTIKYEVVVVSAYHNGFTLAYDDLGGPFTQAPGHDITFGAQLTAQNVSMHNPDVVEEFRNETRKGQLKLEVGLRAQLRFEVEGWKHRHYILKVICSPVVLNLTSARNMQQIDNHTQAQRCTFSAQLWLCSMKNDINLEIMIGIVRNPGTKGPLILVSYVMPLSSSHAMEIPMPKQEFSSSIRSATIDATFNKAGDGGALKE